MLQSKLFFLSQFLNTISNKINFKKHNFVLKEFESLLNKILFYFVFMFLDLKRLTSRMLTLMLWQNRLVDRLNQRRYLVSALKTKNALSSTCPCQQVVAVDCVLFYVSSCFYLDRMLIHLLNTDAASLWNSYQHHRKLFGTASHIIVQSKFFINGTVIDNKLL